MYDNKTGEVVLLDYPRYDELDDVHKDYRKEMKDYYTKKYTAQTNINKNYQAEFYEKWVGALDSTGKISVD